MAKAKKIENLIEKIKQLRELSGISITECKDAIIKSNGDIEKALAVLKEKGRLFAEKKSARETRVGVISSYIHINAKVGSLIELNCETDFVAKNEEFRNLARELAIQVAGFNPLYISKDDVSQEELKRLKEELLKDKNLEGKPDHIKALIIKGKIEKEIEEKSLLEEPYFREESIKVRDLINQYIQKLGENIKVKRFVRFEI